MSSWFPVLEPSFFHAAAFWLALAFFSGPFRTRFVVGLLLGGALTRVAWAGFHFSLWLEAPWSLIDRSGGFSILGLPLGPLLVTPFLSAPGAGQVYRAAVTRALAPALAVARLGCVVSGCCGGRVGAGGLAHPVAIYETVFWIGFGFMVHRVSDTKAAGLGCVALGGIRLALEPLRSEPPLGPPDVDVSGVAALWILLGVAALCFDHVVVSASGREEKASA